MRDTLATCAAVALIATSIGAAGAQTFHLATEDATVELRGVEVHRVTSDNTIDLVAVFSMPDPAPKSSDEMLIQLAELCLRYKDDVVAASVPMNERKKMNMFVPLYQADNQQDGFAFQLRKGECTLEPPFPETLVAKAHESARTPLD